MQFFLKSFMAHRKKLYIFRIFRLGFASATSAKTQTPWHNTYKENHDFVVPEGYWFVDTVRGRYIAARPWQWQLHRKLHFILRHVKPSHMRIQYAARLYYRMNDVQEIHSWTRVYAPFRIRSILQSICGLPKKQRHCKHYKIAHFGRTHFRKQPVCPLAMLL